MKQNLFWAAIYNLIAIPVAAGAVYPAFGALAMRASSITVVSNALLLRRESEDTPADNASGLPAVRTSIGRRHFCPRRHAELLTTPTSHYMARTVSLGRVGGMAGVREVRYFVTAMFHRH